MRRLNTPRKTSTSLTRTLRTIAVISNKEISMLRMPTETKVVARRRTRLPSKPRKKRKQKQRRKRKLKKRANSMKKSKRKLSFIHMIESSLTVRVVRSR